MQRRDFAYDLPSELIAQEPLADRSASRLLHLSRSSRTLADHRFSELPQLLRAGDLLVVNDTQVLKARLHGTKASGGRAQVMLDRQLTEHRALAFVRASKTPRTGGTIHFGDQGSCEILGRRDDLFELRFSQPIAPLLAAIGQVPLPPYIDRPPSVEDEFRYQTVFAAKPGAVAAPTASLHFDAELLERLRRARIDLAAITLHVGAGTFAPVRDEDIQTHKLHAERVAVDAATCSAIADTRSRGGRVLAVGTTVVRALEAAARETGEPAAYTGETRLFITPGFEFRVVDGIITNFHLPESSLLMLVAAFSGRERILRAYQHAIAKRYRFFSYGDAMLLL